MKQINVRYPQKDIERLNQMVEKGHASSISDYVRQATREKLARDSSPRGGA